MSMNDAILAVAQAQQQGDAIPVDVPPMTQSAPDMVDCYFFPFCNMKITIC